MSAARCPPEPWRLRGDMYVSLWRLPPARLPRWPLPTGVRPLVTGKRCTLLSFWADYRPGGTLAYHELLIALAVTHRRRIAATAVEAWVDDEQSLLGGRALWGVPKQSAALALTFPGGPANGRRHSREPLHTEIHPVHPDEAGGAWALGVHREILQLPGRPCVRAHLVQQHDIRGPLQVPLRLKAGGISLVRSRFSIARNGPLAFLVGHQPRLSVAVRDFRAVVGPGAAARRTET
ncbi:acetoacetate decarboxylase family protein [Streptomyces cavernae]|uniref:acetoacetate decarboxylase family protein n=1 Tax=Streptomyces cavernae TaxID=2259034 RepID=UPI0013914EEB|nr:acetoacetate decarboxylase family protein [Streptomyces cavernae]